NVAIRDWDAQGTSNKALTLLGGGHAQPDTSYDILIYDTPPSLEHQATAAAVRSADIAVVVTTPSPADVWEAEEAIQFVRLKNSQPKALLQRRGARAPPQDPPRQPATKKQSPAPSARSEKSHSPSKKRFKMQPSDIHGTVAHTISGRGRPITLYFHQEDEKII